jgi:hypothetical protein
LQPTIDNADTAPLYLDFAIDAQNEIARDNAIFALKGDIDNRELSWPKPNIDDANRNVKAWIP